MKAMAKIPAKIQWPVVMFSIAFTLANLEV
jgi:hypothetical protein